MDSGTGFCQRDPDTPNKGTTISADFLADQPFSGTSVGIKPTDVQAIRVLGKGRAATARLVDATFSDGRTLRCVEKVFQPGKLTRLVYRFAFFAPFAYQANQDAIAACFYRRRVAANVLRRAGVNVHVAEPLYVRYSVQDNAWVLAARHIDGRGIRPASPFDPNPEIKQILNAMRRCCDALSDAGLTGSGWQVDPAALVSTANLLRNNGRYVIIDLESGIPAVLVPRYVARALRSGSLIPFDDLDEAGLRASMPSGDPDTVRLIEHTRRWKAAEPSPFRAATWKRLCTGLHRKVTSSIRFAGRLIANPQFRTRYGIRSIRRSIDRWHREQRIGPSTASRLHREIDGREVKAYARGMALHLTLKAVAPMIAPVKFGGLAAAVATGSFWFLTPWLILPFARTAITIANWNETNRQIRHAEAMWIGLVPTLGSAAFAFQMLRQRPELAAFIIRDFASRLGRKVPIYGGKDSRTELAMIAAADRLLAACRIETRFIEERRPTESATNTSTPGECSVSANRAA